VEIDDAIWLLLHNADMHSAYLLSKDGWNDDRHMPVLCLKDNVTIAQEESMPNIWNGTTPCFIKNNPVLNWP